MANYEVVKSIEGKKSVCVIGAGASGLTVMKELLNFGHSVKCFDENCRIGGVYAKSYDGTMLTTSSLLTAYSDYSDGQEDNPKFWNDEEYLAYLDGFACEFGLYENIDFRSSVRAVTKRDGKWLVTVGIGGSYVWPHRSTFLLGRKVPEEVRQKAKEAGREVVESYQTRPVEKSGDNEKVEYEYFDHVTGEKKLMDPQASSTLRVFAFDAIAVCTGTNTWSSLPKFDGKFDGPIIHAEHYRKAEVFRGKRVLVVGAGESGSDICNEISKEADKVAIAIRGKHGHIIPRRQADGRVTDLNTNRCRYSNPYVVGDLVGYVNQIAKRWMAKRRRFIFFGSAKEGSDVLKKIGELNMKQKTSAFSKFGCKNEGFVTAMVTRGAELHRDHFKLEGDKAVFDDGSEFVADAIVACTGYKNSFPMFVDPSVKDDAVAPSSELKIGDLDAAYGQNPRKLYKQIFCPVFPDGDLAFFGFARPAFGSIPPTAEMQSRFYALVIDGQLKLPSTSDMEAVAVQDQAKWEYRFSYDKRVKGLVDFQIYCDDLASQYGALPPLRKIFFTKPKLWWKIMFGPFTMHQYRLVGPYANPERAQIVYAKQPVGDLLESCITASFLMVSKFLSLIGLKKFTPNNF